MVAQVAPPPFAEQLSISVFGYQISALEQMRVQARLALLAGMTKDEGITSIELRGCFQPRTPAGAASADAGVGALAHSAARASEAGGGRPKTNMRRFSVSIHSVNSCWLQQVSICSLMEKFRLRSVLGPARGSDEWNPRRRAPFWVFQSRGPTEAELKKQAAFQGKARAKVVSWVT